MIISPYSNSAIAFTQQINSVLVDVFGLITPFRYEDIKAGESYGIASIRSVNTSGKLRTGIEKCNARLEILIVSGYNSRLEAEANSFAQMLNLDHGIPVFKDKLEGHGLVYDLLQSGETTAVQRQSVRSPHPWYVDITTEATAFFAIAKDAQGQHIPFPSHNSQLTNHNQ